ncbi:tripartite motif-containing protein 2 [Magallana gigas]|uniref:tripartite motif-containing protein 2 n=1 Tax=Magallana gigas TaxID=29159 RepID=UPI00333E9E2C
MALSKPVSEGVEQVIAQHYLMCGTADCKKNCQFYCNPCHHPMCEQCKDEHKQSPESKSHEVVVYRHRNRKLPVEKCRDHPSKDIDMICEDCQVLLCSKCAIQDHRGHIFADLETIYSKNFSLCLDEIRNIYQYFLPTIREMKRDIREDAMKLITFMDDLRALIKSEAESMRRLVDEVMSDKLEQVVKLEETLKDEIQSQYDTYKEYKGYLEDIYNRITGYMTFDKVQSNPILFSLSEHLKIKPIPETTKPIYPVFTAGQYSKDDFAYLFGNISTPDTLPEKRRMKPKETPPKRTLSLSSSVDIVKEYTVPSVKCAYYLSLDTFGGIWVSDNYGNLVHADLQGNQLQKILTSVGDEGYHSVTKSGDLIYTDSGNNTIKMITLDKKITEFMNIEKWTPLSIHSSNINGDILVGMSKGRTGKVTRYNSSGKEIQNIQRDSRSQGLYISYPRYITENINGDICISDYDKSAVVVLYKTGQHKFSYTGQGSKFRPFGICTDIVGHILVCDNESNTVHLLDQDGQFLLLLLTEEHGIYRPVSVCVDADNKLYVGQFNTNKVKVYEFLE